MSNRVMNAYLHRQAIMEHGTGDEKREYMLGVLETQIRLAVQNVENTRLKLENDVLQVRALQEKYEELRRE